MTNEYKNLMFKYEHARARIKELETRLESNTLEWNKTFQKYQITDKLIREFCEKILSTDPKENNQDHNYKWSKFDTNELIKKAENSYKNFMDSRTERAKELQQLSEERRLKIEDLTDEIKRLEEELGGEFDPEEFSERSKANREISKAMENQPAKVRELNENGDIEFSVTDHIDNFNDLEEGLYEHAAGFDTDMRKIQENDFRVRESSERKDKKEQIKKKKEEETYWTESLQNFFKGFNDIERKAFELLGESGKATTKDITEYITTNNSDIKGHRITSLLGKLESAGVLGKENFTTPLTGSNNIFFFTPKGKKAYEVIYGKEPTQNEAQLVKAEHSSYEHGYTIIAIANEIEKTGIYNEVIYTSRKTPVISASNATYMPDITCIDANDVKHYFEYELNTCTETQFFSKCNKMVQNTKELNFIGKNKEGVEKLSERVEAWIKTRGQDGLKKIVIRITPAVNVKDTDLRRNKNWKYVYNLRNSKDPEINF